MRPIEEMIQRIVADWNSKLEAAARWMVAQPGRAVLVCQGQPAFVAGPGPFTYSAESTWTIHGLPAGERLLPDSITYYQGTYEQWEALA